MQFNKTDCRPVKIARLRDVISQTGLARSTIYAKISPKNPSFDPTFPQSVRLGERSVGWIDEEVCAWILSCPRAHGNKEEAK